MQQFTSPYPLKVCVERLQRLDRGTPPLPSVSVIVRHINDETYSFSLKRWAYLNMVAEVKGELRAQNGGVTNVTAKGSISLHFRLVMLVSIVFAVIIMFLNRDDERYSLLINLLFFLYPVLPWLLLRRWRNQLMRLVIKTLTKPDTVSS